MENKLNIPQGDYGLKAATETDCALVTLLNQNVIMVMPRDSMNDSEETDIAALCADSINTYQQCNLLPSELLRQRDNLIQRLRDSTKVLKSLKLSMMAHPDHEPDSEFWDMTDSAQDMEILNEAVLKSIENE